MQPRSLDGTKSRRSIIIDRCRGGTFDLLHGRHQIHLLHRRRIRRIRQHCIRPIRKHRRHRTDNDIIYLRHFQIVSMYAKLVLTGSLLKAPGDPPEPAAYLVMRKNIRARSGRCAIPVPPAIEIELRILIPYDHKRAVHHRIHTPLLVPLQFWRAVDEHQHRRPRHVVDDRRFRHRIPIRIGLNLLLSKRRHDFIQWIGHDQWHTEFDDTRQIPDILPAGIITDRQLVDMGRLDPRKPCPGIYPYFRGRPDHTKDRIVFLITRNGYNESGLDGAVGDMQYLRFVNFDHRAIDGEYSLRP